MKYTLTLIALSISFAVIAQPVVDVSKGSTSVGQANLYSVGGQPFLNVKFVELTDGSPYFRGNEWFKAIAVAPSGQEFKELVVRLDLFDKQIIYLEKGNEYVATTPVKEITLIDSTGKKYLFKRFETPENKGRGTIVNWYQSLVDGKVSLMKEYKKNLLESKAYGSPKTDQKITTKENYLVYMNNMFLEVKKLKDIPDVLADKKAELQAFLDTKDNKKASMDDRYIAIIEYYNSLKN